MDETNAPTVGSPYRADAPVYIKRQWSGIDNWKCGIGECIFDTFDPADCKPHFDEVHGPNAIVVPPPGPS